LLKAGGSAAANSLQALCNQAWEAENIPSDWRDSIVVPLPKKGDRTVCTNWRGIALLSTAGKVLASIILNRIKEAVDRLLRQEQAGFCKSRSCCEQVFALRQIIEKVQAREKSVYLNFIDFKKAFNSVHRDTLWKILQEI